MLLGQHLGRSHQRTLVATLDRGEERGERDDRLARADVALQQPVHGRVGCHVAEDLVDRPPLVAGERERQRGMEPGNQGAVDRVSDPLLRGLDRALAGHQSHLHAQELVEPEAALRASRLLEIGRLVHLLERPLALHELELAADRLVERDRRSHRFPAPSRAPTRRSCGAAR